MLKLLEFIADNDNWKEALQTDPFYINIKEDENYMLFSYNMIESDFSNPIVQECRGLILRKSDFAPVCVPFFKFFNVQEGNAANIDWSTARVQSKIDGSIIKVWYDDWAWHVSTNGMIDAHNAELQTKHGDIETFFDLFIHAENMHPLFFNVLNTDYTYIFELVSPFNRVVVPYKRTEIYHIGTRDNNTMKELNEYIGIQKPEEHSLRTLDECLTLTAILPFDVEGYVVVDANWNRVKIKSAAYVAAHHLKNNGVVTKERVLDMIRAKGQDDFVSVYPEYLEMVDGVMASLREFLDKVEADWQNMQEFTFESRKQMALWVNGKTSPAALFLLADQKVESVENWLFSLPNKQILKYIGEE